MAITSLTELSDELTGSSDHLAGEYFGLMAGLQLLHVPYKSGPQAMTDLIGGQLTIYMGGVPVSLPMVKSGKLRPLGVSSLKRIAQLPDVPTIAEAGVPNFEVNVWYGLLAPRATPPDRKSTRLNSSHIPLSRMPSSA